MHGRAASLHTLPYGPDLWSRLAPSWNDALRADPTATAFQSADWIQCWIATYGERLRPIALVWSDPAGAALGASLVSLTRDRLGPFPVRRAWLNATGEDEIMSEHNTLLGVPYLRASMATDVGSEATRRGADQIMISGFGLESAQHLRRAWPAGAKRGHESEDRFVDLAALRSEGREYLASLSRNTREQVRRAQKLYTESFGAAAVEVAPDAVTALRWQSELVELHEARWRGRGGAGSFATPSVRMFHHTLQTSCASDSRPADALRVDLVRVRFGDETVALLYNLVFRGVVYFYQSGLRYHESNKLKPGLVAHALAIQYYLGRDEIEYDFLAGEPTAVQYKRSLASTSRQLVWEELSAPTHKMRLVGAIRDWRQRRRDAGAATESATELPTG